MTEVVPLRGERQLAEVGTVIAVPFLNGSIPCVEINGEPMVILRPISDLLGLNWASQYTKLSADQAARVVFITTRLPGDDRSRRVAAVSLETFTIWLARLTPSRMKYEARDTVISYQREAGRALRDHFFNTTVEKVSDDLDVIQSMLDAIRADRQRIAALETEHTIVKAKLSAIEGQHDHFTALGYAKLTDRATDRPYLSKVGRHATRLLRDRGEEPHRRQDATFGAINVYPADVLEQAFEAVRP